MRCARTWASSASSPRGATTVSRCCLPSSPMPAMRACPRMHARAYRRLLRSSPPVRSRLSRSRSGFSRITARMRIAKARDHPQHRRHRRECYCRHGSGCFDLQDGSRLCGLDRHRLARGFNRRQAATGSHLQARRPIFAAYPDRRSARGLEAGACAPREIPLGDAAFGAQAAKGGCSGDRQQDSAYRLGGADQEGKLSCTSNNRRGSVERLKR